MLEVSPHTGRREASLSTHRSLRPQRLESLVFEQQGENLHVVMAVALNKVLICNDTGRLVLDLCDGSRTVAEIVDAVSARFPQVNREQIEEDVEQYMTMAVEIGVVTWV